MRGPRRQCAGLELLLACQAAGCPGHPLRAALLDPLDSATDRVRVELRYREERVEDVPVRGDDIHPGANPAEHPLTGVGSVYRLLQIRQPGALPKLLLRMHRITTFNFAAEIASRFAECSAFLIGDAAHRVTPRGGTGISTAIADGHDLGWKLGWVLNGWASGELSQYLRGGAAPDGVAQPPALS